MCVNASCRAVLSSVGLISPSGSSNATGSTSSLMSMPATTRLGLLQDSHSGTAPLLSSTLRQPTVVLPDRMGHTHTVLNTFADRQLVASGRIGHYDTAPPRRWTSESYLTTRPNKPGLAVVGPPATSQRREPRVTPSASVSRPRLVPDRPAPTLSSPLNIRCSLLLPCTRAGGHSLFVCHGPSSPMPQMSPMPQIPGTPPIPSAATAQPHLLRLVLLVAHHGATLDARRQALLPLVLPLRNASGSAIGDT